MIPLHSWLDHLPSIAPQAFHRCHWRPMWCGREDLGLRRSPRRERGFHLKAPAPAASVRDCQGSALTGSRAEPSPCLRLRPAKPKPKPQGRYPRTTGTRGRPATGRDRWPRLHPVRGFRGRGGACGLGGCVQGLGDGGAVEAGLADDDEAAGCGVRRRSRAGRSGGGSGGRRLGWRGGRGGRRWRRSLSCGGCRGPRRWGSGGR